MDEWLTIYTGDAKSAESLSAHLAGRSVETRQTKRRHSRPARKGRRAPLVLVEVRSDQADIARSLYEEWRLPRRAHEREASRRRLAILALSLLVPAGWLGAWLAGVAGVPFPEPVPVFALWMLCIVVVSQLEHRRRRTETVDRLE